jgi:hypothetical protein
MAQQFPQTPVIDRQTYASPMSYIGSGRRLGAWASRGGGATSIAKWLLALPTILAMWCVVTCWYVIAFGLFGVFTFPYRFIRRGQRKALAAQKVQLATMQAMLVQQQEALGAQSDALAASRSPALQQSEPATAVGPVERDALPSARLAIHDL